jgi:hypothetical protein
MRTTIFAYKGFVGIQSHPEAEYIVAKTGNGNLGVVVDARGVDVSPEALELLKQVPKSRDDIGEFDVFQSGELVIIGWLGGYKRGFRPEYITGSSSYNPDLLKPVDGVEVPEDFKQNINNYLKSKE